MLLDAPRFEDAAVMLRALAHPVRLAIVTELADGERCVHELVDALGVSQPLVSQHLRVLRGARLLVGTRRGREIVYRITDDHVVHVVADAVEHAAETDAGDPSASPIPTGSTTSPTRKAVR
jgi:DNA-binding transcriptional ArsR family regulator